MRRNGNSAEIPALDSAAQLHSHNLRGWNLFQIHHKTDLWVCSDKGCPALIDCRFLYNYEL